MKPIIGLILEGSYDEAAIPVLLRRCRPGIRSVTRNCRGPVAGKFLGIVAELSRSYRVDRVLVVSDADGREPMRIVRDFRRRLVENYGFEVVPIVVVEMLEAWLIADPIALESVLGIRKDFVSPERIRDPKAALRKILPQSTVYTPEIARRIAEKIDLKLLQKRCPRYSEFRAAIVDS
ncbi:MAG: DUF4276 family protein [Candidatus Binatus sp.]